MGRLALLLVAGVHRRHDQLNEPARLRPLAVDPLRARGDDRRLERPAVGGRTVVPDERLRTGERSGDAGQLGAGGGALGGDEWLELGDRHGDGALDRIGRRFLGDAEGDVVLSDGIVDLSIRPGLHGRAEIAGELDPHGG